MTIGEAVFLAGLTHLGLVLLYGLYLEFDMYMDTRRWKREIRRENEAFRAWAEQISKKDWDFAEPDEDENIP